MVILPANPVLPNNPRIGWHDLVRDATVGASSEATGFPVANLANDLTYLFWRASSAAAQTLTFTFTAAEEVDYIGIARHNLGTNGVTYELQRSPDNAAWTTVAGPTAAGDNGIILHEFDPATFQYWRLLLGASSSDPAQIACVYLGRLLTLERRIYVGHTPLPFGLKAVVSTGRSESGQYLGRVLRRSFYETNMTLQNLDPDTTRDEILPFVDAIADRAFFWAWRPQARPDEVGFVWTKDDVNPLNQRPNGMMQFDAALQGIIE